MIREWMISRGMIDMIGDVMRYMSADGYRGTLIGRDLTIVDGYGRMMFHTSAAGIRTMQELKKFVDEFPEFLEVMTNEI